jgi:hypothetical protein
MAYPKLFKLLRRRKPPRLPSDAARCCDKFKREEAGHDDIF